MSLREILLALFLLVGLALIVAGVATWSVGLALIVAGLGLAGLGALLFVEVEDEVA